MERAASILAKIDTACYIKPPRPRPPPRPPLSNTRLACSSGQLTSTRGAGAVRLCFRTGPPVTRIQPEGMHANPHSLLCPSRTDAHCCHRTIRRSDSYKQDAQAAAKPASPSPQYHWRRPHPWLWPPGRLRPACHCTLQIAARAPAECVSSG